MAKRKTKAQREEHHTLLIYADRCILVDYFTCSEQDAIDLARDRFDEEVHHDWQLLPGHVPVTVDEEADPDAQMSAETMRAIEDALPALLQPCADMMIETKQDVTCLNLRPVDGVPCTVLVGIGEVAAGSLDAANKLIDSVRGLRQVSVAREEEEAADA